LNKENQEWQNWYNSNKEIFSKLFSKSPPCDTLTDTSENKTNEDIEVSDTKNKKNSKVKK
jgi:hypothetical protein